MANQLAESWLGVPDIWHPKKIFLFFCFILLGKVFIINITIFKLFYVHYLTYQAHIGSYVAGLVILL